MMKRLFQCMMTVILVITLLSANIFQLSSKASGLDDIDKMNADEQAMINILSSYAIECSILNLKTDQELELLGEATVQQLSSIGYEAYNINNQTYYELENELNCSFDQLGMSPEYHYIIVISGEAAQESRETRSTPSSPFTYTYGGTTYTMRYLTVTAADDPAMGKASSINVLQSSTQTIIQNCLNTMIYAYIDSVSSFLGTVASICGLDISDFGTGQATMYYNCGTNWTRVYTQVWSSYDNRWQYGSCVEYTNLFSYMSGTYYDAHINQYKSVPTDETRRIKYSSNYSSLAWRKQNAVIGFLYSSIQYDCTGDMQYYYGDSLVATHYENF